MGWLVGIVQLTGWGNGHVDLGQGCAGRWGEGVAAQQGRGGWHVWDMLVFWTLKGHGGGRTETVCSTQAMEGSVPLEQGERAWKAGMLGIH